MSGFVGPVALAALWERCKATFAPIGSGGETAAADYVVETGTENTWSWRKWKSGFAECWRRYDTTSSPNTAWGSIYYDKTSRGGGTMPITFSEVEGSSMEVYNTNCWLIQRYDAEGNTAPGAWVCCATSMSNLSVGISMRVWGWL